VTAAERAADIRRTIEGFDAKPSPGALRCIEGAIRCTILAAVHDALEQAAVEAENNRFGWHTEMEAFAKQKGDWIAECIRNLQKESTEQNNGRLV
jgi:hypothetical protein